MSSCWKKAIIVAVVGVVIVLAFFWVVFPAFTTTVNYWTGGSDTLNKGVASVTVFCNESGNRNVSFNLTLTLISFAEYTGIQKTVAVWNLAFMLNNRESAQKTVDFPTNDMYAFELILSFEKMPFWSMVKGSGLYPTSLAYIWLENSGYYVQIKKTPTFS